MNKVTWYAREKSAYGTGMELTLHTRRFKTAEDAEAFGYNLANCIINSDIRIYTINGYGQQVLAKSLNR